MDNAIKKHPRGFDFGFTSILCKEATPSVGLDFGILRLREYEQFDVGGNAEYAMLLLHGKALITYDDKHMMVSRQSVFDDSPSVLHIAAHRGATIRAQSQSEFVLVATHNDAGFESKVFDSTTMIENEHRGRGLLDDTAYRMVRTIFDKRNRPSSNLVLGEVVTFPGRWSSYPPHYHAQPEIYHYRFTEPQGYGHAELGEQVYKIHQFDTLTIQNHNTHAQVSAPGYGMFYVWAIRHLANDPYITPTFVDEHAWTKGDDANRRVWKP